MSHFKYKKQNILHFSSKTKKNMAKKNNSDNELVD